MHPGALGDLILFGRLLSRLDGQVTLAAGREKAELLAGLGMVKHIIDFEALPMHELFLEEVRSDSRMPALLGLHDRLVSCFAGGNRRAELRLAALCGAADASFLPVRPPAEFSGHLTELWMDMLGLPHRDSPWPALAVPFIWQQEARGLLTQAGLNTALPYVVMHPGAGSPSKCWPAEWFLELASHLHTPGGEPMQTVFIVGPVEVEQWGPHRLDALQSRRAVISWPPLTALAGLLSGAWAFVGNDSGPSHLAAAAGTPTVAIFGPTNPVHFAPLGPRVSVVHADNEHLADLGVSRVLRALGNVT